MNDRTLVRGLFLVAISLAFGLQVAALPDRQLQPRRRAACFP